MMSRDIRPGCPDTSQNADERTRTPDLLGAIQALSQLSYSPASVALGNMGGPEQCSRRMTYGAGSKVGERMGLFDEAIREHLELKRRRGADPSAIAREEHEAMAPVFLDAVGVVEGERGELVDDAGGGLGGRDTLAVAANDAPQRGAHVPDYLGQETAELDMQAVIDEDPEVAAGGPAAGPLAEPAAAYDHDESSAWAPEWTVEGEQEREPAAQIRGLERFSFE